MEDYIIREIDRIGEMLMQIARRLGLLDGDAPDYSMSDVKDEFGKAGCPVDLVTVLQQEYPVWYLVEKEKLSVHGLETMIDIIFHSDLDEEKKQAMLQDALAYLDGKGTGERIPPPRYASPLLSPASTLLRPALHLQQGIPVCGASLMSPRRKSPL